LPGVRAVCAAAVILARMTSPPYLIEAEGLVKSYGKTAALAGLDLAVPAGRVLGLLGPNGAGKTTAVRILATLLRPDQGRARVGGFDVAAQPAQVRALIGLTGQYAAVDEDLTGQENLMLIGRLLGLSRAETRRRAADLLGRFGLAQAAGRLVKTYSGGMRRRLDLTASLIGRPRVLFLDEPTTGLDPAGRNGVWDLVRDRVGDGMTVLLTTQNLDEADRLAGQITVIDQGREIASGTPAELKAKVGGQTLDVRLINPAQAADAARIVAAVVGTNAQQRDDSGLVSAPVTPGRPGSEVLTAVAARLDQDGLAYSELGLRLASLDEVFLALTGHQPRTESAESAERTDRAGNPEAEHAEDEHVEKEPI
jgi:oleandomycin transport system ATP-binding protein